MMNAGMSLDALLCQLQENEKQLKLMREKYESSAWALHEERRRSEHFLKLLIDKQLRAQTNTRQDLPVESQEKSGKQAADLAKLSASAKPEPTLDLETDGERELVGRTCSPAAKPVSAGAAGAGETRKTRKSRLEEDDAVVVAHHPLVAIETVSPGYSRSTTTKSSKAVEPKTVPNIPKFEQRREANSLGGKLLDDVRDEIIAAAETEASIGMLAGGSGSLPRLPDSISIDLLNKVMQQNARLKKLLKQIVDSQGISVQEFLVIICIISEFNLII